MLHVCTQTNFSIHGVSSRNHGSLNALLQAVAINGNSFLNGNSFPSRELISLKRVMNSKIVY